jgi:hypothetical protein
VRACSPFPSRARAAGAALLAIVAPSLALAACGGGARQDVAEPTGNYPVAVTSATFPASQSLSQHTHMQITVKNTGTRAIPDLAVTICNVTCAYNAPPGEGSSSGAFASNLDQSGLANPSRPVWIVDRPPGSCQGSTGYSCRNGGAGGDASAYNNTWAYGRLAPGASAIFDWAVTAENTGRHTLAWVISAGLNGKAQAVVNGGGAPHGTFTVQITGRPSQSYVDNNGNIVTTQSR